MKPKKILNANELSTILHRLSYQLIEDHNDFYNTVLIGIQPRGPIFANRLRQLLINDDKKNIINLGFLDITFFRDDFRRSEVPHNAKATEMEVSIEGKNVVLIDDVLFTGRSIRSALTAIDSYGRPESIELLVLVDRRFSRHLPIQPDYLGAQIDALQGDKVKVVWSEGTANNIVYLEKQNQ